MTSQDAHETPHLTDASALRIATFRLARRLRAQRADDRLSNGQFAVLVSLYRHTSQTLGELAAAERVTAPSMHRTVTLLEEAGLAERSSDERDGRKVNVALTPLGREVIQQTIKKRDAWLEDALDELTTEEREILVRAAHIARKVAER